MPTLPLKYRWRWAARQMLKMFYDQYVEDLANSDKATSQDDHSYYEGRIDVSREVIFGLTGRYLP